MDLFIDAAVWFGLLLITAMAIYEWRVCWPEMRAGASLECLVPAMLTAAVVLVVLCKLFAMHGVGALSWHEYYDPSQTAT